MDPLLPQDQAEETAIFRASIIGHLSSQAFDHGGLKVELERLATVYFRAPGSKITKRYGLSTLERWHYAHKNGGLAALLPARRSDFGNAREIDSELRALLIDIKREHPTASANLVLRTLVGDGRIRHRALSCTTLRRLWRANGLGRRALKAQCRTHIGRRRWEAGSINQIWHADVCHGPSLTVEGGRRPLRIHAILDDKSRYIIAIQALETEREADMLALFTKAMRAHGKPGNLYLDNGATYIGEALATACARLKITLKHAAPYDPQARGKMERFWRTLRAGCLNHLPSHCSHHDVQVRLLAFVDRYYHRDPHGGLLGQTPSNAMSTVTATSVDEAELRKALTVRGRRRVRGDGTISVGGLDWEVVDANLASQNVTVLRNLAEPTAAPRVEYQERLYRLIPVDPVANGRAPRKQFKPRPGIDAVAFNPTETQLAEWLGRGLRR